MSPARGCIPVHRVRGDKRLDANVKAAVGVQPLIPPDRAHWPRYITAQEVHRYPAEADRVPLAGWCGTVRVLARGAEPLAGNCCLVAGQRLRLSGHCRQPLDIIAHRRWFFFYIIIVTIRNSWRCEVRD